MEDRMEFGNGERVTSQYLGLKGIATVEGALQKADLLIDIVNHC